MAFEGQGTTVTFGASGYSFNIISVGETGKEGEDIETTHLLTEGGKTYIPAELYEGGEVPFTVEHDPTQNVVVPGVVEDIAIDFGAQGRPVEFEGYIKGYKVSGAETGARVTATLTVKVAGDLDQVTTTAA